MNRLAYKHLMVLAAGVLWGALGCSRPAVEEPSPSPADSARQRGAEPTEPPAPPTARERLRNRPNKPALEPRVAMLAGLMPRASTGVDAFLARNPTFDGRGVLIGILDSGLDPALPGFQRTTTGQPKILDLRDFSGEGRLELREVTPAPDGTITVAGRRLTGFAYVAGVAGPPYYAGEFRELPLGDYPASDVNGNGTTTDVFPVIVVRTSSGWAVVTDTDNDGRLNDEQPIHDYDVAAETFTYALKDGDHGKGPLTIAVNVTGDGGRPVLDLFFDNSSHGSHVGGIAAGHDMFGVDGFDGIAPGAQLLGVKISNNARGGISVTGSMVRAMNYAAAFAEGRGLPLVLNLSFGVGNEVEGAATIDSLVNEFALAHPGVLFAVSAGNDGPGISTVGFPGSASYIVSVCALYPGVFSGPRPPGLATDADVLAWFSSRGGELAKPDLCAPGVAFSNVPRWNLGEEVSGGTSMAAPQLAGAAALLQSAMVQRGRPVRGIDLKQALITSAQPIRAGTAVDMGEGVPKLQAAYQWLLAGHQAGYYDVAAVVQGGNHSTQGGAYRREGLASSADTVQQFVVRPVTGQPAARFFLRSDRRWLRAPSLLELDGNPAQVNVSYAADQLRSPGLYVGTVWAVPATDTLAGAAFRLTNTVVVPRSLEQPFVEGRDLGPGRIERYYFQVPENAGGITVELQVRYPTQQGSLYLFEPDGQPFRDGSNEDAGGSKPNTVRMSVRGEDVVPGVYEAVVVAPPTSALSYDLRAALPRYAVERIGTGPSAVIRNLGTELDSVELRSQVIGAVRTVSVTGRGATPEFVPVPVPQWASELVVEVRLPQGTWGRYTDFGVTVFDTSGAQVGQGPLNYVIGRKKIQLKPYHRNQTLSVELFPAFARLEPPPRWEATVKLSLLAARPVDLRLPGMDTVVTSSLAAPADTAASADSAGAAQAMKLEVAPGREVGIQFTPVPDDPVIPSGFSPLIEVAASPGFAYRSLEVFSNPVAAAAGVRRGPSN